MRRTILATVLLLASCTQSRVDPEADVVVSGRAVRPDGSGSAGRQVILLTDPTFSDIVFGLPIGIGSLGLACLADAPPPPCDTRRSATTAEDGSFRFQMKGRETQGLLGDAKRLLLTTDLPASEDVLLGPASTATFNAQTEELLLPDVRLWGPDVTLSGAGGRARTAWSALPSAYGSPSGYTVLFEQGDRDALWSGDAPGPPHEMDARILEDTQGGVTVAARTRLQATGSNFDVEYRSARVPYLSAAGTPASRGAGCAAETADGRSADVAPCRLTDGDMSEPFNPEVPCPEGRACAGQLSAAVIDLGAVKPVQLAVVRGCEQPCTVEASSDRRSWTPLGTTDAPFAAISPSGRSGRYVRVRSDGGLERLAEVSVWDRGPADTDVFRRVEPARVDGPAPRTGGDGPGGRRGWLVPAGIALLVVAAAVAGAAWGRRRGRPSGGGAPPGVGSFS